MNFINALFKKTSILVFIFISILFGEIFIAYRLYTKILRLENVVVEYKTFFEEENAFTLQAYAIRNDDFQLSDGKEHHILCLGNSITQHQYKDSIGWKSDWGMAASSEQKDYCHVLEQLVKQYNKNSTVTPLNIAVWERNLSLDKDSLLAQYITGKDVVIIRLGENVEDKVSFKTNLIELVRYCQTKTDNVVITGCFWKDKDKEISIINASHQCHIKYIPLYWLSELYKDEVYPKEGDTLRDIKGKLYTIKGNFITTHPNDEGMVRIAETIFENIK